MVVWICRISTQNGGCGFNRKKINKENKAQKGKEKYLWFGLFTQNSSRVQPLQVLDTSCPKPRSAHQELESHKYKMWSEYNMFVSVCTPTEPHPLPISAASACAWSYRNQILAKSYRMGSAEI